MPERIATFDNDGTLWCEQPMYFQAFFVLDRITTLAPQHPEWQDQEPFASVLKGDMKTALAGSEKALVGMLMATHAGMTTDEFEKAVTDWISTARHPVAGKPFTEMVYQPMLELLTYLQANNFKTFIVSGGGIEFMRPWTEKIYGIPPEQVVGSSGGLKYELRDGTPVIVRTPELVLNDDKDGKPVGIQRHIGRRPIAAFGNSDGDFQMLEWTTSGKGPRLGVIIRHTDAEREFAYDHESHIGKLDRGLDEAVAKDAYSFAYPLAQQYRTMYVQAIDATSKEYVGGFGKYRHYGMSNPDNKDIVTPNNDTPYSWAHVDLRAEPWVLTLPKTDGRYFTTEWMDLWHFILDNPGSVIDGGEGGNFLLAPPNWKREMPNGIKRIVRGESEFMGTLTRTQLKGVADLPAMQKTQQGYKLQPLSAFLGQPTPAAAPEIKWPVWVAKVDQTADIFRYVNFMLPYTTPNPLDQPTLDRIAKIGIAPGKPWDLAKMKPEMRQAIEDGVVDALKLVSETIPKVRDAAKLYLSREKLKTDYLNRTMGVVVGQWGNDTRQAIYLGWPVDADGAPPDASKNSYTITFPPGKLPNYKFFWSITMYNLPERLLVPNPIKRYSMLDAHRVG